MQKKKNGLETFHRQAGESDVWFLNPQMFSSSIIVTDNVN